MPVPRPLFEQRTDSFNKISARAGGSTPRLTEKHLSQGVNRIRNTCVRSTGILGCTKTPDGYPDSHPRISRAVANYSQACGVITREYLDFHVRPWTILNIQHGGVRALSSVPFSL